MNRASAPSPLSVAIAPPLSLRESPPAGPALRGAFSIDIRNPPSSKRQHARPSSPAGSDPGRACTPSPLLVEGRTCFADLRPGVADTRGKIHGSPLGDTVLDAGRAEHVA